MRVRELELLKGKIGAALVCFFVIATTAGTWAAYSYAVPAIPLLLGSAAYERVSTQPQTSNTDAKVDRLAVATLAVRYDMATAEPEPAPAVFALASASMTVVEPPKARIEPRVEPRKPAATPEKPKRAVEQQKLLLDDSQISALRSRLKLSPTQEEFWPAVEVTLRNVVRQHARKTRKDSPRGAPQIDVNSPEVQELISAAVPLIMRLSEEQKREVRQLARIIGLETVASRI
jgi:hypothetical protein